MVLKAFNMHKQLISLKSYQLHLIQQASIQLTYLLSLSLHVTYLQLSYFHALNFIFNREYLISQ